MKSDKYVLSVIDQLTAATNKSQVEEIITTAMAGAGKNGNGHTKKDIALQLQARLENLSPLNWNSTQWGCLRYALIYLRKYLVVEAA